MLAELARVLLTLQSMKANHTEGQTMSMITANSRAEAAAVIWDAREGGGIVRRVIRGYRWVIYMGSGGVFDLALDD